MSTLSWLNDARQYIGEVDFDSVDFSWSVHFLSQFESRLIEDVAPRELGLLEAELIYFFLRKPRRSSPDEKLSESISFTEIPTISKEVLRSTPERVFQPSFANQPLWCKKTSGTTGRPVHVLYDGPFYFDHLLQTTARILHRAGVSFSPNRLHCVALTDNVECTPTLWVHPRPSVGPSLQIVVEEHLPSNVARVVELLHRLQPECLTVKPSLLETLVQYSSSSAPLSGCAKTVICSGANLPRSLKNQATALFGVPVIEAYGMTEFGIVASECPFGSMHFDSNVYAEILNPDNGTPEGDQPGELVLSSVRNQAFPLLRYRTGDLGQISLETCRCGSRAPILTNIFGRMMLSFKLPSGRLLSPARFNRLFETFHISEFQVTQLEVDRFHIFIENAHASGVEELASVCRNVEQFLEESCTVTASFTTFKNDGKFERFRSSL